MAPSRHSRPARPGRPIPRSTPPRPQERSFRPPRRRPVSPARSDRAWQRSARDQRSSRQKKTANSAAAPPPPDPGLRRHHGRRVRGRPPPADPIAATGAGQGGQDASYSRHRPDRPGRSPMLGRNDFPRRQSLDSSNGPAPASRLLNKGGMSRGILGPEPCCRIAREGGTISYARQMPDTYDPTLNLDPGLLAAAIDAAGDCAQACTADTDADLSETNLADMVKCLRLCLDCTDDCSATAAVLTRLPEYDPGATRPLLAACVAICKSCA